MLGKEFGASARNPLLRMRMDKFSVLAEPKICCLEQYCNCNLLKNTIFCGSLTGQVVDPCTPWVVDLFSKEGVLIQDTQSGRYKNRAGNGCEAPDYIEDAASQKIYCDQCTPTIQMGKTKTSYANI